MNHIRGRGEKGEVSRQISIISSPFSPAGEKGGEGGNKSSLLPPIFEEEAGAREFPPCGHLNQTLPGVKPKKKRKGEGGRTQKDVLIKFWINSLADSNKKGREKQADCWLRRVSDHSHRINVLA